MAAVSFKKGLLANLPTVINEGSLYITTDERAIYLDVDTETRIRIGDFQEFDTLAALQANTNPSATALYYVAELNVLAKWDGEKYVQINLDTGATDVSVTGNGNAIDGATYNAATRTLVFTKTTTFATTNDVDSKIAAKVGELTLGDETFETVKAYIDKKTDGIATDTALSGLTERVEAVEGEIDTLNGTDEEDGSIAKAVKDAINDFATKVSDDGTINTFKELVDYVANHGGSAAEMASAIEALETKIGDKSVATQVSEAITALKIGDYAKAADIADAVDRIVTLEGKAHEHENKTVLDGITAGKVDSWDAAEQNAKDYADGLAGNYDPAGAADDVIGESGDAKTADTVFGAKAYADAAVETAMAWGTF